MDEDKQPIRVKGLEVNRYRNVVTLNGKELRLTPREIDLLTLFITNRGKVYTRRQLLELVWEPDFKGDDRTVDVHIRRLREKIEKNTAEPEYIMTKWGVGYYFTEKD